LSSFLLKNIYLICLVSAVPISGSTLKIERLKKFKSHLAKSLFITMAKNHLDKEAA
jgi:hypothetical protein